jgi:hypothetical protein
LLLLLACWLGAGVTAAHAQGQGQGQPPPDFPSLPALPALPASAPSATLGPAAVSITAAPAASPATPVLRADPSVRQAAQPPRGRPGPGFRRDETPIGYRIPFELPGPERLFRLESESSLYARMQQEARERRPPERITFPEEPTLSRAPYYGRDWPAQKMIVEPIYVCHRRLLFEQINGERYAWDLGVFHPLLSAAIFYKDVIFLPYHIGTQPLRCYECSAGKCQPGDPVPLLLYPPELSVTGLVAEAGVLATLFAVFP